MSKKRKTVKRRSIYKGRLTTRNRRTAIKNAKGRKNSSTNWLKRQLNDPYVKAARQEGYRSRAAYKLLELNERFSILRPDMKVVELGAAPGGWSQVISQAIGTDRMNPLSRLIALDIVEMDPIPGVDILTKDFFSKGADQQLKDLLEGKADSVLCDIAPPLTGHVKTDHLRIIGVVEAAYYFACDILNPGGSFIAKVFQGGTEQTLLAELKEKFQTVKHAKPPASRSESSEKFLVAQGFHSG